MQVEENTPIALSIVVSVYNEEAVLPFFWRELAPRLDELAQPYEVIFVDDGSVDGSRKILAELAKKHTNVRACFLSRNFGHEAAMLAGIDSSRGDAVICMDADLQHPPNKIAEMFTAFREGADIVHMRRTRRRDAGVLHRLRNKLFYVLINRIVAFHLEPGTGDFFLISRQVADVLRTAYRERTRFLRGFIQMVGFRAVRLDFEAPDRAEGVSKYSLWKLLALSAQAVISLSNLPLRLGLFVGVFSGFFAVTLAAYTLYQYFFSAVVPAGYTTLVIALCVLFSLQFILIGIQGLYIEHIFTEVKKRPLYLVERMLP